MPGPKKLFTVFGATGLQGGSIVSTFITDAKLKDAWTIRGVTRDVNKDAAKNLAEQGVEVVAADMNDKASVLKAIQGSYAVFSVTNYWEKMDMKLEIQQGRNMAEAAKEAGVQHYIWSSLHDVSKLSNGKLKCVYHFDGKAQVEEYVRSLDIPATFFLAGVYMNNFPGTYFKPGPPDDAWTLAMPMVSSSQIPMFAVEETGKYVKAIILNREELLGKRFLAATSYMTAQELVDEFREVFPEVGKTARYFEVSESMYRDVMRSQGAPEFVIDETYENVRLLEEFGYYGGASLDETHRLVTEPLTTWKEYAKMAGGFAGLK